MFLSTFDIVFAAVHENETPMENPHPTFFEVFIRDGDDCICRQWGGVHYTGNRTRRKVDATNAIDVPFLTIITSISLDHTGILGETIEEIAAEKAGILKRDVPIIYIGKKKRVQK